MNRINFYKAGSHMPRKHIRSAISGTLLAHGAHDVAVSVSCVDKEKMAEYVKKYYKRDDKEHLVLAFPNSDIEGDLGDIIIQNTDIETMAGLAAHATLHLLGVHHD